MRGFRRTSASISPRSTGWALGADAAAELWRGASASGAPYAVKWSGGGTPAGLLAAVHLVERGVPGVVAPMPGRSGRLWTERESRRLFLLPWVSGVRALDDGMSAQHWVSFGEMRAQAPGGHLRLAFQVGDEPLHVEQAFSHTICLDFRRWRPDHVAGQPARAGLALRAQLQREPDKAESVQQAFLLAHETSELT